MRHKLKNKGWSDKEISHAESILKLAERNKHKHVKLIDESLYWVIMIIGIIGSFFISLLLIPILISANSSWSYAITGIFSFLIGCLIVVIIKDINWINKKHHAFALLVIPLIAVINLFIVSERVNLLNTSLKIANIHNSPTLGLIYFVGFLMPYIAYLFFWRKM